MNRERVLIITPTYNERDNIRILIDRILQLPESFHVLVVDDSSPDGTSELIEREYAANQRVQLLKRQKKSGIGTAYSAGFAFALQQNFDLIITMDADLSHDSAMIPILIEAINNHDIVIGSRYVRGGAIEGEWGIFRKELSRYANALAHRLLALQPADCTSGFRIYRKDALRALEFSSIAADGYSYLLEILYRARKNNLRIAEVPIRFVDRKRGKSKISSIEIFKAIHTLFRLGFAGGDSLDARNSLRQELLGMIAEDERVRQELAADGSLFEGYHPRMEAVHKTHAARLREIIQRHEWPGITMVGADGEEAAWGIAQHAISEPELMRNVLKLLKSAAEKGEAPLWQVAMTEDRIRLFEGQSQLYGTSFDWDEEGQMSPYPAIENPESVDQRRATMGLPPLQEEIVRKRQSDEQVPSNIEERRKQMDQWARSTGWRTRKI